MRLLIITCVFGLAFPALSLAQQNDHDFWENVRFGGGLGLSFGNRFTTISISPNAIYQFNDQFGLGLGLHASYVKERDVYSAWVTGGSLIGLYSPIREIQLSAEFEELNVARNFEEFTGLEDQNYWYPALFLGVGYSVGHVTLGIRYDVLYDEEKSIYAEPYLPFIRILF
ncbi:alpha-ketoglutarate decarboxylase [Sungkyunkwania multivorans]|uniref:Alpha-ketoglutarate decarboxylase n=1 Tax=Sungkyunkwania multivorans TaxID=1173618 RepID=A0ABW3D0V2_9FLAO